MARLSINISCLDCQEQMKIPSNTGWPGVFAAFGQFGVDHNNDSGKCIHLQAKEKKDLKKKKK